MNPEVLMRRLALVALSYLAGAAALPALAETVTVDLTFSEKALAELTARGEGIVVASYWMGDPAPGATLTDPELGTVYLQSEELTMHARPATLLLGTNLPGAPLDQVVEPRLNLNVYSARWTDENNLLHCDLLDGVLSDLAAAPRTLHCKLIGE
jgi:hypothetical protein